MIACELAIQIVFEDYVVRIVVKNYTRRPKEIVLSW